MRKQLFIFALFFSVLLFAGKTQRDTPTYFPETFPAGFFADKCADFPPATATKPADSVLIREATQAMHETGYDTIGYEFPYLRFKSKKDSTRNITLADISWLMDINGDKTPDLVMSYYYGPLDCGTIVFFKKGKRYSSFQWLASYPTAVDYSEGKLKRFTDAHWACCEYAYATYISKVFKGDSLLNTLEVRIPSHLDSLPPLKLEFIAKTTYNSMLRPKTIKQEQDKTLLLLNGTTGLRPGEPIGIYAGKKVNGITWYLGMAKAREQDEYKLFIGWIPEDEILRP